MVFVLFFSSCSPERKFKFQGGWHMLTSKTKGLPAQAVGRSPVIKSKNCESQKTLCDCGWVCVSQERFTHSDGVWSSIWMDEAPNFTPPSQKKWLQLFIIHLFFFFLIYSLKLHMTLVAVIRYIPNCCRVHLLSPINSGGGVKYGSEAGRGGGWRREEPNTQITLDASPPACTDLNTTISLASVL